MIHRFRPFTKFMLLILCICPLIKAETPEAKRAKLELGIATQPQMILELITLTMKITMEILKPAISKAIDIEYEKIEAENKKLSKNLSEQQKNELKEKLLAEKMKKLETLSNSINLFDHFLSVVAQIQQENMIKDPATGKGVMVTVDTKGNKQSIPGIKYSLKLDCIKGKKVTGPLGEDLCNILACSTQRSCMSSLFRDLVGYSEFVNGKKIKTKGLISELIKIFFTGYKVEQKDANGNIQKIKKPSLFDMIATLANMPEKDKKIVIDAMKNASRILKLIAAITYTKPIPEKAPNNAQKNIDKKSEEITSESK